MTKYSCRPTNAAAALRQRKVDARHAEAKKAGHDIDMVALLKGLK